MPCVSCFPIENPKAAVSNYGSFRDRILFRLVFARLTDILHGSSLRRTHHTPSGTIRLCSNISLHRISSSTIIYYFILFVNNDFLSEFNELLPLIIVYFAQIFAFSPIFLAGFTQFPSFYCIYNIRTREAATRSAVFSPLFRRTRLRVFHLRKFFQTLLIYSFFCCIIDIY